MSMMLDHVRAGLNFVVARKEYSTIAMAGLSGGGWTTTVYAALDDRIDLSMSVAGTMPMAFRSVDPRNWGDWEQHEPGLISIADYSDLYLLGSAAGREAYLVFNEFDKCCFGGSGIGILRSPLRKAAANLNGTTDLFINSEKEGHIIPEAARQRGGPRESDSCVRWDPTYLRRISEHGETTEFFGGLQGEGCA